MRVSPVHRYAVIAPPLTALKSTQAVKSVPSRTKRRETFRKLIRDGDGVVTAAPGVPRARPGEAVEPMLGG